MSKKKADAEKSRVGRPSSYRPEYAQMLRDHFDIDAGYDTEAENSKGVMQSVRHAADFPTLAGFACKVGVHRETLLNWAAVDDDGEPKNPEFFDAYKQARDHQERILVQNGLKGGYHASFAIFTAKNVLGWRDSQQLEHTGKDGGPVQVVIQGDDANL